MQGTPQNSEQIVSTLSCQVPTSCNTSLLCKLKLRWSRSSLSSSCSGSLFSSCSSSCFSSGLISSSLGSSRCINLLANPGAQVAKPRHQACCYGLLQLRPPEDGHAVGWLLIGEQDWEVVRSVLSSTETSKEYQGETLVIHLACLGVFSRLP